MEQLINITDAIFLGHVGEVELGASALASVYYLAIYMLGFGFSLGLQVMIARRNGEQRYKETEKNFFQGLFFLSGLAVFLSFTSYVLSPVILKFFIHSPEIYKTAVDYLEWRCFGLLLFSVSCISRFLCWDYENENIVVGSYSRSSYQHPM